MAKIVAGIAMSHSPLIMTNYEAAGEKGMHFVEKANEMKEWLEQSKVDALVLISDDHFRSYYYDHMPAFTLGIGECEGWGDWQLPQYNIPVEKDLAKHILNTGLESGFDLAFSMSMKVDHGHAQAIYFLMPDLNIPIIPLAVNTAAPPLPTMDRCFQLGEMLKKAISSWDSEKRVAVVASGGLSHWVPIPKIESKKEEDQHMIQIMMYGREKIADQEQYSDLREKKVTQITTGPVNEEWDRIFLDKILKGDLFTLRNWGYEEIEKHGGNGGQEIHNWLVLLGALEDFTPEVVYYEPIPEWVTGMALARFKPKK